LTSLPGNDENAATAPLLGDQTPRILTFPEAKSSAGAECVELAASFGLFLDPWQELVLHHALGEKPDNTWAAGQIGLCVPRQCGKGSVLEARMLAALFLFEEPLTVYSAHEFPTSLEMLRRLEVLIGSSDENSHMIKAITHSNGKEGIELTNGCRALFKTRTKSGGKGLSGDCVIMDEGQILSWESLGALMPTLSARPSPQLWFVGSAVDQQIHANGEVFASVRRRGLDGSDPSLVWAEWSCTDDDDPADPKSWAKANPGMGYRIRPDHIAAEYRALRHSHRTFLTERLGVGDWPALAADEHEPVIAHELWEALAVTDEPPVFVGAPALALDRSPDGKVWTLAAAMRTQAGAVHVEIGFCGHASNHEVLAKVMACVVEFDPAILVIDTKSSAAPIRALLAERGVEATMTTASEFVHACGGFVDDIAAGRVSHTSQEVLNNAVANGGKRELSAGGWAWNKNTTEGDISPLVAATLAHFAILSTPAPQPKRPALVPMSAEPEVGLLGDYMKVPF
jgi:phage terminase large subunit-like protein